MRLFELKDDNKEIKKWGPERKQLPKDSEEIEHILHYKGLGYVLKVICLELISRHHDGSLTGYFRIEKNQKLIARKYLWPMVCKDIKVDIKSCNMYFTSKAV